MWTPSNNTRNIVCYMIYKFLALLQGPRVFLFQKNPDALFTSVISIAALAYGLLYELINLERKNVRFVENSCCSCRLVLRLNDFCEIQFTKMFKLYAISCFMKMCVRRPVPRWVKPSITLLQVSMLKFLSEQLTG